MVPNKGHNDAVKAASQAVLALLPKGQGPMAAEIITHTALARYLLARAAEINTDDLVRQALTSERPWDMVRLITPDNQAEAAILSALPIAAQVAQQIDPEGKRSFFQWKKEEVVRLFEAVLWAWEESQGRVQSPDHLLPPDSIDHNPPPPPPNPMVMAGVSLPASAYRGPVIDDEVPF